MSATISDDIDAVDPEGPDLAELRQAPRPFPRVTPWLLTVGGALGLWASLDLTIEKIALLQNPDYVPSCSFNPVVDCGAVASSPQASVFGFSNTVIGIVGFSVVLTLGVLLLVGGRVPRPVWLGLNAGLLLGVGFVHWLIVQSVFEIGILCLYCMLVWSVTIPLFWYVSLRNLAAGEFGEAAARSAAVRTLASIHPVPVILWYVTIASVIGIHFAENWASLL